MMNRTNSILVVLVLAIIGFIAYHTLGGKASEASRWQFSYDYDNRELAYDRDFFIDMMKADRGSDNFIRLKERFSRQEDLTTGDLYLFYDRSFTPDRFEIDSILQFVARGNNAMIVSKYFGQSFKNRFEGLDFLTGLNLTSEAWSYDSAIYLRNKTWLLRNPKSKTPITITVFGRNDPFSSSFELDSTSIKLEEVLEDYEWYEEEDELDEYGFFEDTSHLVWPEAEYELLSALESNQFNAVKIKYGKGTIILHSNPVLFTNVQLDKPEVFEYVNGLLGEMEYEKVYWDELRFLFLNHQDRRGTEQDGSYFQYLFKDRSLRTSFYFLLFGILFFILFGMKRKYNPIAIIEPVANSSIEFAKTIARLYWLNPDHKKMANLKVKMFLSEIRNRYGLSTHVLDEDFRKRFVAKSGAQEKYVNRLFDAYELVQKKKQVHEDVLIQISEAVEHIRRNWK